MDGASRTGRQRRPARVTAMPLRVLLVEDEPLNRALVRAILARETDHPGIALLEADTIAEARRILTAEPVDVVLLDVRLPDGSGLDLAGELRASADGGGGPPRFVAILSASVLEGERQAAAASGADEFLGKPFAPRELIALLDRFRVRLDAQAGR